MALEVLKSLPPPIKNMFNAAIRRYSAYTRIYEQDYVTFYICIIKRDVILHIFP